FLKKLWFGTDKVSSMALLRKSAHFGIYFVLGIISFIFSLGYSKKYLMAVITGVTFPAFIACFDEYNQEFFERGAALTDVMIDISGAVAGTVLAVCVILVVKLVLHIKRKNGQGEKKA
ncbi:MAG TPA: VanZ family protein, partial [Petrotogaceae bacterium]|nr:VanZ family protein [Petrotogaceae bacterium]